MPQTITIKGTGDVLEFPDEMSDEQIAAAIAQEYPQPAPGSTTPSETTPNTSQSFIDQPNPIMAGLRSAGSSLYQTGANAVRYLSPFGMAENLADVVAPEPEKDLTSLITGEASKTPAYTRPANALADFLEKQAQTYEPTPEQTEAANSGVLNKILTGVSSTLPQLPLYGLAGLGGPAGFGALGAVENADKGPEEMGKSAVENLLFGKAAEMTQTLPALQRMLGLGGYNAAQTTAQQATTGEVDLKDVAANAALGAGLGLVGGKKETKPTKYTEADRLLSTNPKSEFISSEASLAQKAGLNDQQMMGLVEKGNGAQLREVTQKVIDGKLTEAQGVVETQRLAGVPLTNLLTPEGQAVETVIQALKEAKPLRDKQELLYHKERVKRAQELVRVQKEGPPGEAGYYAQLSTQKGPLPKVQFESIRPKITQEQVETIFSMVRTTNKLLPYEKVNAETGLVKLMGISGGTVPNNSELELLSKVFPQRFIETSLQNRPRLERLWNNTVDALNIPRALTTSVDLSAPFRQGLFLVSKHPVRAAQAFKSMFKVAFSEKAYQNMMQDIEARPTYPIMRENKLAITDIGKVLSSREETFMSNLAERIPGIGRVVRGSNRGYSGFLSRLRADVFDDLLKKADLLGATKDNPKLVADLAKFINSATGRGDLGALNKHVPLLNGLFFSPRLMASRLNLLNPWYYVKLDPFVRKEALGNLLTFAGTGMTLASLAALGGADIETDPRNSDFGKVRFGNTRYDIWGGFQQYAVLGARLLTNKIISSTTGKEMNLGEGYKPTTRLDVLFRFFRSKEAPVASFVTDMLAGRNSVGEEFEAGPEMAKRFIPMLLQDFDDLYKEYGVEGLPLGIPSIFGTGVQTYETNR